MLSKLLSSAIQSGYKKNAFAPIGWFCSIVLVIFIYAALKTEPPINYWLYGACMVIVLFCLVCYTFMLILKPGLLQSEGYRLEDRKLDIIEQKGGIVTINPVNMNPIDLIEPEG